MIILAVFLALMCLSFVIFCFRFVWKMVFSPDLVGVFLIGLEWGSSAAAYIGYGGFSATEWKLAFAFGAVVLFSLILAVFHQISVTLSYIVNTLSLTLLGTYAAWYLTSGGQWVTQNLPVLSTNSQTNIRIYAAAFITFCLLAVVPRVKGMTRIGRFIAADAKKRAKEKEEAYWRNMR